MDFLKEANISDDTINYLNETLMEEDIEYCISSKEDMLDAIKYFQSLNINNVEDILKDSFNFFICGKERLIHAISKFDVNDVVSKINEDYRNAFSLEFYEYN